MRMKTKTEKTRGSMTSHLQNKLVAAATILSLMTATTYGRQERAAKAQSSPVGLGQLMKLDLEARAVIYDRMTDADLDTLIQKHHLTKKGKSRRSMICVIDAAALRWAGHLI